MSQPMPQVGDIWEVKRPGKRKLVKEIGDIRLRRVWADKGRLSTWVDWKRLPKGRYSGVWITTLMDYGRRLTWIR